LALRHENVIGEWKEDSLLSCSSELEQISLQHFIGLENSMDTMRGSLLTLDGLNMTAYSAPFVLNPAYSSQPLMSAV
jgi:hypothetical protein